MTTPQNAGRKSRRRKFLFVLISLVVAAILLEVVAWLVMSVSASAYQGPGIRQLQNQLAATGRSEETAREIIHPYFGWVYDSDSDPGETFFDSPHYPVNDFGFPDDGSSAVKQSDDEISIAILGGSFAHELSLSAADQLIETLKTDARFAHQEINIVRLAMNGYKQPQQLMIVNYFFAIGAKYDYVINLDGFNEAVLPIIQNGRQDISYTYPRDWHARLKDVVEPDKTAISYRLLSIRAHRQELAREAIKAPWKYSALAQLIWKLRDDWSRHQLLSLSGDLVQERINQGRAFLSGGPEHDFTSDDERYGAMADLWMNSSRQIHAICQTHGSQYLHFLQPNQYVPDSKSLTEAELESAYGEYDFETRTMVETCYPLLQDRSQRLRQEGIEFTDLTQLFAEEKQTLYRDKCCHVNPAGYAIVAKALAEKMISLTE